MRGVLRLMYISTFIARFFVGLVIGYFLGATLGMPNIAFADTQNVSSEPAHDNGDTYYESQLFQIQFTEDLDFGACESFGTFTHYEDRIQDQVTFESYSLGSGELGTTTDIEYEYLWTGTDLIDPPDMNYEEEMRLQRVYYDEAFEFCHVDLISEDFGEGFFIIPDEEEPPAATTTTSSATSTHDAIISQAIYNFFFLAFFVFFGFIFYFRRDNQI